MSSTHVFFYLSCLISIEKCSTYKVGIKYYWYHTYFCIIRYIIVSWLVNFTHTGFKFIAKSAQKNFCVLRICKMTDPWNVESFDILSHFSMPKARWIFLKIFPLKNITLEYFDSTIFLKYFLIFASLIFLFKKYNKLAKMLKLFQIDFWYLI